MKRAGDLPLVEVKVVVLGQMSSGKTSLIHRYIRDVFNEGCVQSTIGASFFLKKFPFNNFTLGMGLWDTAGSERYESLARMYYRDAKAAIICYDISNMPSYERAIKWTKELVETSEDCLIYLCGTKLDLIQGEGNKKSREFDIHDVLDYADTVGVKVFETSSKTGEGIIELFTTIAKDLSSKKCIHKMTGETRVVKLQAVLESKQKRKCFCVSQ